MFFSSKQRDKIRDLFLFLIVLRDGDGVLDEFDNCPDLPNGDQADADGDKKGKNSNKIERFRNTFTANGKREFVPRDHVFPSLVLNCFLLPQNNY